MALTAPAGICPGIVAIGASAGGVEALQHVIGALPAGLLAAVVVVLHLGPRHESMLAPLLGRHAHLPVRWGIHDDPIEAGTVYVGPPDDHLLVIDGRIALSHSPHVRFARPAVDRLFETVAKAVGPRAIAVVLTGMGSDGTLGLGAVKRAGGITIAQDPATAAYPSMPRAACASGEVDHVLPLAAVAPMIASLVRTHFAGHPPAVHE